MKRTTSREKTSTRGNVRRGGRVKTRGNFALAQLRNICGQVRPEIALQKQFADWIGVPTRTYVAYENGERPLPRRVKLTLVEKTDVDASTLQGPAEKLRSRRGGPYTPDAFRAALVPVDPEMLAVAFAADVETLQQHAAALLHAAFERDLFTAAHVGLLESIRELATELGLVADWERELKKPKKT